jgi:hypothetical protein
MLYKQVITIGIIAASIAFFILIPLVDAKAASLGEENAGGSPALHFSEKEFEFQPVIDGAKVVHEFAVANKGSSPLLIQNVKTG